MFCLVEPLLETPLHDVVLRTVTFVIPSVNRVLPSVNRVLFLGISDDFGSTLVLGGWWSNAPSLPQRDYGVTVKSLISVDAIEDRCRNVSHFTAKATHAQLALAMTPHRVRTEGRSCFMIHSSRIGWLSIVLVVTLWTACRRSDITSSNNSRLPNADSASDTPKSTENGAPKVDEQARLPSQAEQGSIDRVEHADDGRGEADERTNEPTILETHRSADRGSEESSHRPGVAKQADSYKAGEPERVLVLANQGPLLIDFSVVVDELPMHEAMAVYLGQVLKESDTDLNRQTTWHELLASDRFRGDMEDEARDSRTTEDLLSRYDIESDGRVSTDELLSFMTRDRRSSRVMQLAGSSYHRLRSHEESFVWGLLDDDLDGRLSRSEMASLDLRLRSRDYNNDDTLQLTELQSGVEDSLVALQLAPSNQPEAVFLLHERVDWIRIQAALEELYGRLMTWQHDRFPMTPNFVDHLDADGDGIVRGNELRRCLEISPHIAVLVQFGTAQNSRPQVRMDQRRPDSLARFERIAPSHLAVSLPGLAVSIIGEDRFGVRANPRAADDFFSRHDSNSDGELSKDEFLEASPWGGFGDVVDGEAPITRSQWREHVQSGIQLEHRIVQARAGFQVDALFSYIDANQDLSLMAREIESAPSRLQTLDQNEDQYVSIGEVPEQIVIGLIRSPSTESDSIFSTIQQRTNVVADSIPGWFSAMDTNGDNEIARTEFLGKTQLFRQLDKNGDLYLQPSEVEHLPDE